MKKIHILFVLILLVGCAQISPQPIPIVKPNLNRPQEEIWKNMIGKWYGEQPTTDGGTKQWINERFNDGTYKIHFREIFTDGTIKDSIEIGQWGVSGSIYFSIFKGWVKKDDIQPSDPSDPYNYDAYHINVLTEEYFEYEHIPTGYRFSVKRVYQDFEFK